MIAVSVAAFCCFISLSGTHLFACATGREKLRRRTKPLLMPLLALFVALLWGRPNLLVLAALLCGCAGDALLLFPQDKRYLAAGMLAFAAGHVLYLVYLTPRAGQAALPVWLGIALVYGAGMALTYRRIRPMASGPMLPGMLAYALLLCCLSAATFLLLLGGGGWMPLAGSVLFLVSDTLLSTEIFTGETRRGNLAVMATYIGAQALLSVGMALSD